MFLFNEAHMYLIIGTGIGVAMISMWLLKRFQVRSMTTGQRIEYKPKPWHSGVMIGGTLFGAGWSITGACPGPIYAQIGGGAWLSLVTLAGALVGTLLFAQLQSKLPR
ncbi:MAG: YeeE/YedE thiosulfate transporter family protein [Pirellulaceae bacterium]|nr:YeeE/YedE thiosulfate transporter family protein [Pirellulaceae bacterium]